METYCKLSSRSSRCRITFLVVDNILAALTNDRQAHPAHLGSTRMFYLYNEIFCDRGALFVIDDPLVVVSGLVKMVMGLDTVNPQRNCWVPAMFRDGTICHG